METEVVTDSEPERERRRRNKLLHDSERKKQSGSKKELNGPGDADIDSLLQTTSNPGSCSARILISIRTQLDPLLFSGSGPHLHSSLRMYFLSCVVRFS